ncbi:MAG TPA: hypothetical protein VN843_24205 [Anaerolineales bacterium]|nr:hypothetical protein [Anaerolineales bacterium]
MKSQIGIMGEVRPTQRAATVLEIKVVIVIGGLLWTIRDFHANDST